MKDSANNLNFLCKVSLLFTLLVLGGFHQKGFFQNKKAGNVTRSANTPEKSFDYPSLQSTFVRDTNSVQVTQQKRFY